jgi:hypothetical protein
MACVHCIGTPPVNFINRLATPVASSLVDRVVNVAAGRIGIRFM